ncbi:MAG: hypothetical protein JNL08_16280 [Planctomycetes bacterium]|nr:hypothetical protein [Planctomycetota bacterium]
MKKRDLALRMSWAEVMAVLHKLQELGLKAELAVLGFMAGTGVRRAEFARIKKTETTSSANASSARSARRNRASCRWLAVPARHRTRGSASSCCSG